MGNLISWSDIHPSIKADGPFVAVVVIDPQRKLCVSEIVELEGDALEDGIIGAGTALATAQAAAARVAAGYRQQRECRGAEPVSIVARTPRFRVLHGAAHSA